MKQSSKHREQESHTESAQAVQQQEAREFANVEEMLREDSAHVEVPEAVKTRLADSISQEMPAKSGSWWKKLFGG